ncbi:galactokinase [Flavobacteriaceae bacterium R38]|nr:galactokinase [Flavobacteriaceae bacterium R38]
MGRKQQIHILSPGRICLFGDHQDYLKLPVIACAIDRFIRLEATKNNTSFFQIKLPDIHLERTIDIQEKYDVLEERDYFASSLKVLRRYACIPDEGYTVKITGSLPVNAGVSSSSAVIIAWIRFLLEAFGPDEIITDEQVSRIAYEAEVLEHGEPGGLMDQYAIGIGNIVFIETKEDVSFKILGTKLNGLIVGDSGIKKETIDTLGNLKAKALEAVDFIKREILNFKLDQVQLEEYEVYEKYVPSELKPYFYAALKNHSITKKALLEFEKNDPDIEYIGYLMNEHHVILRDVLKITVPRIDNMIENALNAGAYGAKIVGSGGGGSIVAIAPDQKINNVIKAIKRANAKGAFSVCVDSGVRALKE